MSVQEVQQRLAVLFDTMDQLTALLEGENKALAENHPERVAETVERKQTLGIAFERQMTQLVSLREALAAMPESSKLEIEMRAARFRAVAAKNQTAIEAARRAAERLVGHIVEAVRMQANPQPQRYYRPSAVPPRASGGRISLSINQTF